MKYYYYKYCIILLIMCLGFYTLTNNLYRTTNIIDVIFYVFPLIYLLYFFIHKKYVMTEKNISKFSDDEILEYEIMYNSNDNTLYKMYVRTNSLTSFKWYELDYDLTISRNASLETIATFTQKVKTIYDLKCYMKMNSENYSTKASIEYNKTEEKSVIYLSFCILVLFYLVAFVYSNS